MKYFLLFILSISYFAVLSQEYQLNLSVINQKAGEITLLKLNGDKQTPVDSIQVDQSLAADIHFKLTSQNEPGVYRVVLGKTKVAEIMNEPPQQLDFIFNKEDVELETDFNEPFNSLEVIQSEENKVWFDYQRQATGFKEKIRELELEINSAKGKETRSESERRSLSQYIGQYNQLQLDYDSVISAYADSHPNLFATKLIKMQREPFLDGNLSENQRKEIFKRDYFLRLDFSDEMLMNSSVYTEKAFQYLMAYAQRGWSREQQEQEFVKAVEIILQNVNENPRVYEFILDYLVRGFERMNMSNVLHSIADKYEGTTCQTDEMTTLERRLAFLKYQVPGASIPDFTMTDINGDEVSLSQVQKEKTILIFWASWCPHCKVLLPEIRSWHQKNKDKYEVISVSIDTSKEEWENAVSEMGLQSWYNLSDLKGWDGVLTQQLNIYATPTIFILDTNRQILSLPMSIADFYRLQ